MATAGERGARRAAQRPPDPRCAACQVTVVLARGATLFGGTELAALLLTVLSQLQVIQAHAG